MGEWSRTIDGKVYEVTPILRIDRTGVLVQLHFCQATGEKKWVPVPREGRVSE